MLEKKIKVALISRSSFQDGGGRSYEINLINYFLRQNNSEIEFVIFEPLSKNQNSTKFKSIKYKNSSLIQFLCFLRATNKGEKLVKKFKILMSNFEKCLKSEKFDLIYFLSPNPIALGIHIIPLISTVWDLGHRDLPEFPELSSKGNYWKREFYYSKVLPRSTIVVTDSEITSNSLHNLYNVSKDKTIEAGLFPTKLLNDPRAFDKEILNLKPFIIYPANFWPHKNHEFLVDLTKKITDRHPNLKLVLAGSDKGHLKKIKRKIQLENLHEQILVLGFVEDKFLGELLYNANALIYPSKLGPTNLPPLEALMLGTPVITTKKNTNLKHDPTKGVWIVKEDSIDCFLDTVDSIIQNPPKFSPWDFDKKNNEAARLIIKQILSISEILTSLNTKPKIAKNKNCI